MKLLSSIVALASLGSVFAAPSAGCGKTPSAYTSGTKSLTVNNKQRQFIVKLPDGYNNTKPYRLVFTFHALGGNMNQIATGDNQGSKPYYSLLELANNSAIFVSPNGISNGWGNSGGEDLTFVDSMVKALEAELCVEQTLRFATGFSYGGAISYALACARPKEWRAVSLLSSGILSGCQGGTEPVAYYAQHGTSDSVLNVSGARQMRDRFVKNNGCTAVAEPQPNGGRSVRVDYAGCKADYPVVWVIHNGDHNPVQTDQGSNVPFAPGNTWKFFTQFVAK
jgi:poly(3-hydroxybutyrate) depolymerase